MNPLTRLAIGLALAGANPLGAAAEPAPVPRPYLEAHLYLTAPRPLALLEDGDAAIEQIAVQLGYADGSNFHRAFRRWMGVAPGAWRDARRDGADPGGARGPK